MPIVYEPAGKAREYAPLAANLYSGCSHGCKYCFGGCVLRKTVAEFHANVRPKKDVLERFGKDAVRLRGDDREILLSFVTDPYQPVEMDLKITREAIKILIRNELRFTILTKGGTRATRDFDLLEGYDKCSFGTTLVFDSISDEREWEPMAPGTNDRIVAIRAAKVLGIRTWVSLEPVIDPKQALKLIRDLHDVVDHWKVGKINYRPEIERKIDWKDFTHEIVGLLDNLRASYYIKESLRDILKQGSVFDQILAYSLELCAFNDPAFVEELNSFYRQHLNEIL